MRITQCDAEPGHQWGTTPIPGQHQAQVDAFPPCPGLLLPGFRKSQGRMAAQPRQITLIKVHEKLSCISSDFVCGEVF